MQVFIKKPSIDMYSGIRVTKDTALEYENEKVKQTLCDLELCTVTHLSGEGFVSVCKTTIQLNEGDVLIFEDNGRGYIKPVEDFVTVEEAIKDFECIKDIGGDE
jgi:hypothetical protein